MSPNKAFGAFVIEQAKFKLDKAVAVSVYVEKRDDTTKSVRSRIERGFEKGSISKDRMDALLSFVEDIREVWKTHGKIVDMRDPKDWANIGNGARQHINHRNNDEKEDDL